MVIIMPPIPIGDVPLKRSEFQFDLPQDLIAQQPLPRRSDSRLLQLSKSDGQLLDRAFR